MGEGTSKLEIGAVRSHTGGLCTQQQPWLLGQGVIKAQCPHVAVDPGKSASVLPCSAEFECFGKEAVA